MTSAFVANTELSSTRADAQPLDVTTESSSAHDRGCGGSDSSNSEGFYTRINAKEVDAYIQSIISSILPNLNAHLNNVLSAEFLATLHQMILSRASAFSFLSPAPSRSCISAAAAASSVGIDDSSASFFKVRYFGDVPFGN